MRKSSNCIVYNRRKGKTARKDVFSFLRLNHEDAGMVIPFRTKEKTMESVFYVAAYIRSKEAMTHKKLQKLCFYAQSWHYAFTNEILFDEPFEAWIHGPVCPILYKAYKQWGSLEIPMFKNLSILKLKKRSMEIIDAVYAAYGEFSADELEACTHSEYPWKKARKGYKPDEYCRNIISNEDMRQVCLDKMNRA